MKNKLFSIFLKSESANEANIAFANKTLIFVVFFISIYGIVYYFLNAPLAAIINFIILFSIFPLIFLLLKRKKLYLASLVAVFTSTFLVVFSSLALNNQVNSEYYYLPCMLLSLLLFEPHQKISIAFSIFIPTAAWICTNVFPNPFADSSLLASNHFPFKTFSIINFLGATLLTAIFIKFYSQAILRAKEIEILTNQKLMTSSKMVSLGELASGIAHEVNNPLGVIVGRTQLLTDKLKDYDPIKFDPISFKKGLDKIAETAALITKIIKGLKDFSRNADQDPMNLHPISKIINFSIELSQERINKSNAIIEVNILNNVDILCRDTQITQVLVNLISNAIDAVESLPQKWIKISTEVSKKYIYISVIDSGNGISKSNLEKIMQPFFSSKEVGKGLGLGLSISKDIIEAHGGELIYDKNSKNTCFKICLPRI